MGYSPAREEKQAPAAGLIGETADGVAHKLANPAAATARCGDGSSGGGVRPELAASGGWRGERRGSNGELGRAWLKKEKREEGSAGRRLRREAAPPAGG
uniref:DUF834 domain-containing protein n=1 Tax=Oryza sativa subsp. japonica TaxID=39947 RepID=Q6H5N8_ORYSJ|nr:hypothetical protein [Oryza sativa Japonica Group]